MRIEAAIVIMILIDIILFLSQTSITNIALSEGVTPTTFHNYRGSVLYQYDAGNYTVTNNVSGLLPSGTGEVSPTTGGFFTDFFATIKNWFMEIPGVKYFVGVVTAVPNLLQTMGLPQELSFAIGTLWHVMTFVLLISWIFAR